MKKFIAAAIWILIIFVWCGASSADPKKISLIIDGDPVNNDYNASCIEGIDYAQKRFLRKIVTKVYNGGDRKSAETRANVLEAAAQWSDIVIFNGTEFSDLVAQTAAQYPNVAFVLLDGPVIKAQNIYTVEFRDDEAGFIAGALAARVAKRQDIDRINPKSNTIGLILGAKTPALDKFRVGYIAGAWYINKNIKVMLDYVGNFEDAAKAREIALRMRNQGAHVIFAPAGGAGLGAIAAAKANGYWVIGVDVEQEVKYSDAVLTSAVKRTGQAIVRIIERIIAGEKIDKNYFSLGMAEQCIDLSTWTREAKRNLPPDVRDEMDEISDRLEKKLIIIK